MAGLVGELLGFDRCIIDEVADALFLFWDKHKGERGVHRVVVKLFGNELLVRQLDTLRDKAIDPRPCISHLPQLFMFSLRYALLKVSAEYLEGRHRYINLQMSGAGVAAKPGPSSEQILKSHNVKHPNNSIVIPCNSK